MKAHAEVAVSNWLYSEYRSRFKASAAGVLQSVTNDEGLLDTLFEQFDVAAAEYYKSVERFKRSFMADE